ncbi:MAG: hypothetical protein Q9216_000863 [Gyalolechia sp. 2 TL-2023]
MTSLEGKIIVITGAASGIGLATAHLLAARGATVSIADVKDEPLIAAADSIKKASPNAKVHSKKVNVASSQEVEAWTEEVVSQFGKIDGAANLAGVTGKSTSRVLAAETEEEDFDFIIGVNVKGVYNCMKSQLKRLKGPASIVNAASAAGIRGYAMGFAYCASKHAVVGMTTTAANEYGPNNIRVNAIAPGPIDTPMMSNMTGEAGQTASSRGIIQRVPMGRYGQPEEVAKLIAFLLSEESSYTSGAVVTIDGGLVA